MATERMCPHAITLYNFVKVDDDGNDVFSCTFLSSVHVNLGAGTHGVDNPDDEAKVHIFDDLVSAKAADTGARRTFMPYPDWLKSEDKSGYWTLSPQGKDYFVAGTKAVSGTRLPTDAELLRIVSVKRLEMGSSRMWHWKIGAR